MKYHNVKNGNKLIALTIDDLESINPRKPRAIKVYGTAEVLDHQGRFGPGKYLRVTPKISWSFGIAGLKSEGPRWGRVKTVHRELPITRLPSIAGSDPGPQISRDK